MSNSPKTFFEGLNDRFNSTLVISFFFYIFVLNWKAFVYLINTDLIPTEYLVINGKTISKLDFVQDLFSFWTVFLLPLIFTVASILLLPIFNTWIALYKSADRIKRDNAIKKKEYVDLSRTTADWQKIFDEKKEREKTYSDAIQRYLTVEAERDKCSTDLLVAKSELAVKSSKLTEAEKYRAKFQELSNLFSGMNNTTLQITKRVKDLEAFEQNSPELSRFVSHIIADIRSGANKAGLTDN